MRLCRESVELSSFTRLDRRLQFLPLGLLWGLVASLVHPSGGNAGSTGWAMMGAMPGAFVIATIVGSAMLKLELTTGRWTVSWVATGIASCVGGVVIFFLVALLAGHLRAPISALPFSVVAPLTFIYLVLSATFGFAIVSLANVIRLRRKLTPIRWAANCLFRGFAFCVGCILIPLLVTLGWEYWQGESTSWPDFRERVGFTLGVWMVVSPVLWVPMAVISAGVGVLLAPLSVLGRRIILHRTRLGEPAAGASQSQT